MAVWLGAWCGPAVVFVRMLAAGLIAISIPVILVSTAVRSVALSEAFYVSGFTRYNVGRTTGLADAQLRDVARQFIKYFQSDSGPIAIEVATPNGPMPLFNSREIEHMVDVQVIVRWFIDAWAVGGVVLVLGAGLLVVARRCHPERSEGSVPGLLVVAWRQVLSRVAWAGAVGSGGTLLIVGLLAASVALDFRQVFLRFHMLSFANDLWILDPTRDRLIQLFPLGYFFDAALYIATHIVALCGAILLASLITIRATFKRPS